MILTVTNSLKPISDRTVHTVIRDIINTNTIVIITEKKLKKRKQQLCFPLRKKQWRKSRKILLHRRYRALAELTILLLMISYKN